MNKIHHWQLSELDAIPEELRHKIFHHQTDIENPKKWDIETYWV